MRDSADSYDSAFDRVRRARSKRQRKFYQPHDDEATYVKRAWELRKLAGADADDAGDGLPEGDRWSTWDQVTPTERGPKPHPKWLVTDLAAVDYELGVLKTGKEADVFLVRRGVPGTDRSCLLAAKRYRDATHRQFHRDAGYLEGRRTRDTRVTRAAANRTAFGRQAIAGQWANAEFNALVQLYNARVPVPYPVQILGTEILLEFIGDADGTGAPRLAETRPEPAELASLWSQLVEAMATLASAGFAHGDLSPYNLLVHHGRLVMIDLPQVVDVISHPNGRSFLDRDAKNVATWFARAGHPDADPEVLARLLAEEARLALADDRENRWTIASLHGTGSGINDHLAGLGGHTAIMFFISRRVMRGRQGKSLIITGIVLLVIGLAITVGSYALASSRGGGHYYITFTPIIVGIIAIARGISQTRRGNVGYGGPGQEIPQAGYQQPAGYGAQDSGAPRSPDQPGYALPHYGVQGQGTGGAQGQPGGQPAPNWYQDPQDPAMLRWWDGRAWTPHTQPRA